MGYKQIGDPAPNTPTHTNTYTPNTNNNTMLRWTQSTTTRMHIWSEHNITRPTYVGYIHAENTHHHFEPQNYPFIWRRLQRDHIKESPLGTSHSTRSPVRRRSVSAGWRLEKGTGEVSPSPHCTHSQMTTPHDSRRLEEQQHSCGECESQTISLAHGWVRNHRERRTGCNTNTHDNKTNTARYAREHTWHHTTVTICCTAASKCAELRLDSGVRVLLFCVILKDEDMVSFWITRTSCPRSWLRGSAGLEARPQSRRWISRVSNTHIPRK